VVLRKVCVCIFLNPQFPSSHHTPSQGLGLRCVSPVLFWAPALQTVSRRVVACIWRQRRSQSAHFILRGPGNQAMLLSAAQVLIVKK